MHCETVTFQRVFRVVRYEWKGRLWTEFGFETAQSTVYSARVYGHPELRDSMHLTIVLDRKDAWSTIAGWFDHRDGCIRVEGTSTEWGYVAAFGFGLALSAFNLFVNRDLHSTGQVAGFVTILLASLFGVLFFGRRLTRKVCSAYLLRKMFPRSAIHAD